MKLIMAIVSNDDASSVISSLNAERYQVTRLATTGGFLQAGNTTLIIGTEDEKVDRAVEIIGLESSRRTEVVPSTVSYDSHGRWCDDLHPECRAVHKKVNIPFLNGINSKQKTLSY